MKVQRYKLFTEDERTVKQDEMQIVLQVTDLKGVLVAVIYHVRLMLIQMTQVV